MKSNSSRAEPAFDSHLDHMAAALRLARRGLGNVWPNPAVGCIIVKDGLVAGRGWTQPSGRPHAETEALRRAGKQAVGATAYVTLEPCNHEGQTPPCAEALIEAGIARVVVAVQDSDPRVAGLGIDRLKKAGIDTHVGTCQTAARQINAGFFSRIELGRPLITLKTAATLDGHIALANGESQWITGPPARHAAHGLRSTHDAIMVGSGTAIKDNPNLSCRLSGLSNDRRPRIVLDGRLRTPVDSELVTTASTMPLWIITTKGHPSDQLDKYRQKDVAVIEAPVGSVGQIDLEWIVLKLGARGLTRILVEGGGHLAASLFKAGFVDQIAWFRAPSVIGNSGISAIGEIGLEKLSEMPKFKRQSLIEFGDDTLEILTKIS